MLRPGRFPLVVSVSDSPKHPCSGRSVDSSHIKISDVVHFLLRYGPSLRDIPRAATHAFSFIRAPLRSCPRGMFRPSRLPDSLRMTYGRQQSWVASTEVYETGVNHAIFSFEPKDSAYGPVTRRHQGVWIAMLVEENLEGQELEQMEGGKPGTAGATHRGCPEGAAAKHAERRVRPPRARWSLLGQRRITPQVFMIRCILLARVAKPKRYHGLFPTWTGLRPTVDDARDHSCIAQTILIGKTRHVLVTRTRFDSNGDFHVSSCVQDVSHIWKVRRNIMLHGDGRRVYVAGEVGTSA